MGLPQDPSTNSAFVLQIIVDPPHLEDLLGYYEEKARPSLIPSLRTRFTRAGIEWRR